MDKLSTLLTFIDDKNIEVRALAMKYFIEQQKLTPKLKKHLKIKVAKSDSLKESMIAKKERERIQSLYKKFKKSDQFDLFDAILSFHSILYSEQDEKIVIYDHNHMLFNDLITCSQILKKLEIKIVPTKDCEFEDFTFEQIYNKKRGNIILIYALIKKILKEKDIHINLATSTKNSYLICDTKNNVVIDPCNRWNQLKEKKKKILNDYTLFTEFIMHNHWFNLIQGDLNIIYKMDEIIKFCFTKHKLGYPFA